VIGKLQLCFDGKRINIWTDKKEKEPYEDEIPFAVRSCQQVLIKAGPDCQHRYNITIQYDASTKIRLGIYETKIQA